MEKEYAEQAALERQISEAGWHILRDMQVGDGHAVEFQQGPPDAYHLRAQTRLSTGRDRNDAYRHFLEDIALAPAGAAR